MSSSSKNPQIYIGGLSRRTRTEDLEKAFNKYGKIRDVSIKGKYAFIVRLNSLIIFYRNMTIIILLAMQSREWMVKA
jgi:RNA recognition motif-containing protein